MTGLALPPGWSLKRLKYLATYNDEVLADSTDEEKEIEYVEISGVSLAQGIEEIERMTFGQAPLRARRRVRSNDILISTVRTYLRAIARIDEASPDLIASTGFCVVRPNDDVDSGFLGWAAKSELFVSEVVARSVGVSYPAINASEIVTIGMALPPLDTQRLIAWFLDEKTRQIDGLIAKKRQLLDRLAEKRQALITRAVTKGRNPDASMRPSGIDWLGDIPTHWDIVPVRWYMRTASGEGLRNVDIADERTETDYAPVIGGNGTMGFTDATNSEKAILVIGRVGAHCGNVHPIDEPSWITDNALQVYEVRRFDRNYLLFNLRTRDLNALASRNAQPLMTGETVKSQYLPCPPTSEQQAIGKEIEQSLCEIEDCTARVKQSVQLLSEYRSAIISAAVTGQLRQRR